MRIPCRLVGGFNPTFVWTAALLLSAALSAHAEETRLLRFPAIHGDQIAFSFAGDIFTVPAAGGTARRLTSVVSHKRLELFSIDFPHSRTSAAGFDLLQRLFAAG